MAPPRAANDLKAGETTRFDLCASRDPISDIWTLGCNILYTNYDSILDISFENKDFLFATTRESRAWYSTQ